jgi:hypothetical protein
MAVDLRPLTLGELLDRSFSLYRTHLPRFVVLMLPFAVVNALLSVVLTVIRTGAISGGAAPEIMSDVAAPLALMPLLIVALIIAQVVGFALVTSSASSAYVGEPATARAVIESVRPELGSLIWLAALVLVRLGALFGVGVLGVFGFIALARATIGSLGVIGPALGGAAALGLLALTMVGITFLALRYSLAIAAWVNESLKASEALARSVVLVEGQMGRAFVIVVFGVIISQIAGLLLQGPFVIAVLAAGPDTALGFGAAIVGALAASLASAVALPLTTVALVVLYFDARARHEGYDLELMIDAIDPAGGAPAAVIAVVE